MSANVPRRLLLVEDDEDIRVVLTELLRDEGYDVAAAAHGGEALEVLGADAPLPGLILLDLHMPVMDGRQFRARQRVDPRLAAIPVVMFTAGRDPGDLDADAVVPKPVEIDTLLGLVGRYFPG